MHIKLLAGTALMALLQWNPVMADDGHNHGAAAATAAGPANPRFAAASELFELVGVVDKKRLVVYLDRFDDNTPVKAAQVELEIGGAKVELKEVAEGEFEGRLAKELAPGVIPVTATVVAGKETDLLAADLDIHADAHSAAARTPGKNTVAAWSAAVIAVLLAVAWIRRRARISRAHAGVSA